MCRRFGVRPSCRALKRAASQLPKQVKAMLLHRWLMFPTSLLQHRPGWACVVQRATTLPAWGCVSLRKFPLGSSNVVFPLPVAQRGQSCRWGGEAFLSSQTVSELPRPPPTLYAPFMGRLCRNRIEYLSFTWHLSLEGTQGTNVYPALKCNQLQSRAPPQLGTD